MRSRGTPLLKDARCNMISGIHRFEGSTSYTCDGSWLCSERRLRMRPHASMSAHPPDFLSGKEGVDLGGKLEVPVRDASDLMGREVDLHPLVDVRPVGMVIGALRQ